MRVLLVHNPRSGQGDAGLFDLVRELVRRGHEIVLRPLSPELSLERSLDDAGSHDRVIVAGGDGTVAAAAYQLRGSGVPLLPFASGTGNIISLNLREPSDPVALAETLDSGRILRVDLGELTYEPQGRRVKVERRQIPRPRQRIRYGFTGIAGVGMDATMMENALRLKPTLGSSAYVLAMLQNPTPKIAKVELQLDGRQVTTEASAVLLVNFARLQFDITITHDSDAADGLLEVVVIKARNVTELLPAVLAAMLDTVVRYPDRSQVVDTYRARRVRICADPALPLQADGEVMGASTPVSAKVLPLAGTFIVPAD